MPKVRTDRDDCAALDPAADIVGAALTGDGDDLLRPDGPGRFSACGLLAGGVADPGTLTDVQGSMVAGLDHCEATDQDQSVSGRDSLDLRYTEKSFDRLTRLRDAEVEKVAGNDVAVVHHPGRYGCHMHTYLWRAEPTDGHTRSTAGETRAEADIYGRTCRRARELTAAVIAAAGHQPPAGGDPVDLLVPTD